MTCQKKLKRRLKKLLLLTVGLLCSANAWGMDQSNKHKITDFFKKSEWPNLYQLLRGMDDEGDAKDKKPSIGGNSTPTSDPTPYIIKDVYTAKWYVEKTYKMLELYEKKISLTKSPDELDHLEGKIEDIDKDIDTKLSFYIEQEEENNIRYYHIPTLKKYTNGLRSMLEDKQVKKTPNS